MNSTASPSRLAHSLATATGALAATVATAQASTVQITLTGNFISSTTNALTADLTGDGTDDVNFRVASYNQALAEVQINGINGFQWVSAHFDSIFGFDVVARFANGGVGVPNAGGASPQNIKYLNPITFSDPHINGGASTQGYLEVNAFTTSDTLQTVALTRLVFDDASTTLGTSGLSTATAYTAWTAVPEPSSLGLLALGAGGLLDRRRRQGAPTSSLACG